MTNRGNSKIATEELIMDSFKELALSIPIEKITIQEITDKAGVIRATFYNHFEDKYDLLRKIVQKDLIDPVQPMFEGGFFYEGLIILFTNVKKHKPFYLQATKLDGVESFSDIIEALIRDKLLEFITIRIEEDSLINSWFTTRDLAEFYAHAMTFVAMKWAKSGMKQEPVQVAEVYRAIISTAIEDVLHRFELSEENEIIPKYISI